MVLCTPYRHVALYSSCSYLLYHYRDMSSFPSQGQPSELLFDSILHHPYVRPAVHRSHRISAILPLRNGHSPLATSATAQLAPWHTHHYHHLFPCHLSPRSPLLRNPSCLRTAHQSGSYHPCLPHCHPLDALVAPQPDIHPRQLASTNHSLLHSPARQPRPSGRRPTPLHHPLHPVFHRRHPVVHNTIPTTHHTETHTF